MPLPQLSCTTHTLQLAKTRDPGLMARGFSCAMGRPGLEPGTFAFSMRCSLSYLPVGTNSRGRWVKSAGHADRRLWTLGGPWSPCLMSVGLGFYPSDMARMVLLQHTLPDGERHFDWLIEPVGAGPGSALAQLADMTSPMTSA